jgi:predicted 3-demethylubiquinone-9 3-methyltransferase (glyoxalase superfamily)
MATINQNNQKITPFLWFNDNVEEAVNFYTSVFKNSEVTSLVRNGEGGPGPQGSVLTATFQLNGQDFIALNGGPAFKFTEAISFVVSCDTQEEVDELWDKLSEGGEKSRCGWLKDQFGLSWQVVPTILAKLMQDKDTRRSGRVMQEVMKMDKLDIARLQKAYNQKQEIEQVV